MSNPEQRKAERVPVRLIVEYEDADDFLGDYTENLSAGGTFIHTARVFEPDTTVQLMLSFPGLLQAITLEGIIRWSRGGKQPGVGLEFLPTRDYAKLDALVQLIANRDPRAVARVVRVLVAEDNPHICELICNGLGASAKRMLGDALLFNFATAENGASALELLRTSPFDVAIIDLSLPILDGFRVIDHARGELGLVDLPIIAISGAGETARKSALSVGANLYLEKPMRLREVLDSMRQLVLQA
jgi:uncharacterized protein (TIGR02266 family)